MTLCWSSSVGSSLARDLLHVRSSLLFPGHNTRMLLSDMALPYPFLMLTYLHTHTVPGKVMIAESCKPIQRRLSAKW